MTNFRLVQIERTCRPQNKFDRKIEISFGQGRKHCRKRTKCFLLFLQCFQKASLPGLLKVGTVWLRDNTVQT